MSFEDDLKVLAQRASQPLNHVKTEEATKTALVMPFIKALGYDVFDPAEVVPEFSADVGTKQGEKVDYAIISDGKPIMLLECKHVTVTLEHLQINQLLRYFHATDARIGILTNGRVYKFFSDIKEPNKMDSEPFLEVDLRSLDDRAVIELKRFAKQSFDINAISDAATNLKHIATMKQRLSQQLKSPDEGFVKWIAGHVYAGKWTQSAREEFAELSRQAFNELIDDRINSAPEIGHTDSPSVVTTEIEPYGNGELGPGVKVRVKLSAHKANPWRGFEGIVVKTAPGKGVLVQVGDAKKWMSGKSLEVI